MLVILADSLFTAARMHPLDPAPPRQGGAVRRTRFVPGRGWFGRLLHPRRGR